MTPYSPLIWPFSFKRSRDDTTNAVLTLHYLSCLMADIVKLLDRHYIFVGRDLHYAVSTGVNDEIAGLNVMLSIISDNISAGISLVADYPSAGDLRQLIEYLLRESLVVCRKRLRRDHACHLPVSYSRILTA